MAQAFDEYVRGLLISTAQGKGQDQLCVAFDRDKLLGIADGIIVLFLLTLLRFLLLDKSPDFIRLHVLDGNVDDEPAHDSLALLASERQTGAEWCLGEGR